jgi:hypothetical protein
VRLVDKVRQVQQDEGELKRSPSRRRLGGGIARGTCIPAPRRAGNRLVHDAEGKPGAVIVAH